MSEEPDDLTLLERWGDGDASAGEALFVRHFHRLSRFFRAKGLADVDDLVQATFLACVEGRDRFRGDAPFSVFLFRIARARLFDELRARYVPHRQLDPLVSSVADLAPSPSHVLAETARRQELHRQLQTLPLDLQITLELAYWEGMKAREIAEVFEIPEGTVRSRLRLAKDRLRRAMGE